MRERVGVLSYNLEFHLKPFCAYIGYADKEMPLVVLIDYEEREIVEG